MKSHGPLQVLLFFGQIRPGADPGRGKSRSRGPFLQETSSSDQKATATNRMHSNDLEAREKKCCYFGSIPKSNFWRVFDVFFDLAILPYFNAISIDCYGVKCLIYNVHLFCVMSMFVSGRMPLYKIWMSLES